jgi:DNA-binding transcriptional MerR regulator
LAEESGAERSDIRLAQLVAATGLSPLVIRAWERRYGFPRATRTDGGHRRYAPSEVARVHRVVLLLRAGFRPREAIERALSESVQLPQVGRDERLEQLLVDGEPAEALAQLRSVEHALGFEEALEDVVLPALHGIGEGWAAGRYSVAQEHAASSIVISWLGTVRSSLPPVDSASPTVLLAGAPHERHALPPLALEVLLSRRHLAAASLDADVPIAALVSAVRLRRPSALVISSSQPNPLLGDAVPAVLALDPSPIVFVGGPGVSDQPPGTVRLPLNLTAAADLIAAELSGQRL